MGLRRRNLPFLPVFFVTLGIVFVIAVVLRLRSYTPSNARESGRAPATSTTTTGAKPATTTQPAVQGQGEPYQIVEEEQPAAAPAATVASGGQQPPQFDLTGSPIVRMPSATSSLSIPAARTTGGRTGSTSPPAATLASSRVPRSSQLSSSSSGSQTKPDTPKDPKDPTSDTTPPQLLSAEFNPAVIHDGEETMLTIVATDDLSGLRVISGTIATPTGGVQGFALQHEGDSSRYSSRIAVPKDAPEGIWRISYLSLSDNAGNTATLSASQGTLSVNGLRVVSSKSDTKPPTLRAIWVDRVAMRAGEKNMVYVQADDEGTGVNLVSGVFQSPAKFARIGFGCHGGDNAWQCDFVPPPSAECGEWKLEQVQLQDKANNMTTVRSDNPLVAAVRISMTGNDCDSQPPQMQMIALDRTVVGNAAKSTINVTAMVTDDISGVASMSAQVTGPPNPKGTPRLYFSLIASNDPNTWTGQIIVPALAAKGQWEIAWVQILDKANNLRTYSRADAVLHGAVFNVQ